MPGELRDTAPVLFSAHGLPEAYIRRGDPYLDDIRTTVAAVTRRMGLGPRARLCFQSRVGPQRWLGPTTEAALDGLAAQGTRAVLVVPIAFTGEHIETLQEIDILYKERAEAAGIVHFARARTVGCHPAFIAALADLVAATGGLRRTQASGSGSDPDRPEPEPGAGLPVGGLVRVAIVGGGISGLTAAHVALGRGHEVVLDRRGPRAWRPGRHRPARRLPLRARAAGAARRPRRDPRAHRGGRARRSGGAGDAGGASAVRLRGRRAAPLPTSPGALFKSDLFTLKGKLRLLREPFIGRGKDEEESVFDFIARRFGHEAARRAGAPAIIGVYAGDAAALSAASRCRGWSPWSGRPEACCAA